MASKRLVDSNRDNAGDFIGESAVTQSCEPCMKTNISKTATVFCKDCDEYLCDTCKNPHTVYKPGQHNIVNSQGSKSSSVILDMKGMDKCHEHAREIEFFCQDHSKLCCLSCVLIHRKCDQLDEIVKVSRQTRPELQALKHSLIKLQSEADDFLADCKQSETGLNESIAKISSEVDTMKDRIIKLFEEAKQKLISEAKQFKIADVKRIGNKRDASLKVKEELNKVLSMCCVVLDSGTPSQQYIYSELMKEKRKTIESTMDDQRKIKFLSTMTVSFPKQVTSLLEMGSNSIKLNCVGNKTDDDDDGGGDKDDDDDDDDEGNDDEDDDDDDDDEGNDDEDDDVETSPISLSSQPRPLILEQLVSVDLHKTGDDEREPDLSGLDFLPDGRLVAVDNNNMKCIILNERLQRLGTPYKFEFYPQSVVCVSHDTLCVTFGGYKEVYLLSVSTDNTITLTREITTSSKFYSICCMSPSNMVVSTCDDPRPVRMISVDGVESDFDHSLTFPMKTYKLGESRCTYVQSKNTLVLTDQHAHTVYVYDTVNGTSRAVTNENIQNPLGACVGPGDTVLVCSGNKQSIVHLTIHGKILGTYPLDMRYPKSICVSKDGTRLVVSNTNQVVKKLQLYKISPAMS
ncbi:E3 ubiquitin-protein ligase TRIM56-like isoform X3 [Dreissena polymorpha]|uniref:E3 ubiquitin-protein ligase TRIM56-like isoform X3 n=1 Tax=Dreissena polymorpha TaxID=45954 RepID=UPI002264582E|nr:E3 ubiquitin-protein ligase TRIM56-like isoform X3 [Dreissena polymorpha]